jgi:hypothetical protein
MPPPFLSLSLIENQGDGFMGNNLKRLFEK